MSLINKMLRDLDKRHAASSAIAGPATLGMAQHMHSVPSRALASDFFWRTMAMLMLFAIGWVAWVVWQLMPHQVVTELAYRSAPPRAPPPAESASPLRDPAPAAAPGAPAAVAPARPEPPPAPRVAQAPGRQQGGMNVDMLRLATELTTPIPRRTSGASRSAPKAGSGEVKTAAAQEVRANPPAEAGKIDRRANTSYRADQEFRRAVSLVNQGRIAEGIDGFRAVLVVDPGHQAARQTLVALLLEAKRVDEAAMLLQDGLAVNPDNTEFAMILARIMVEGNDVPKALFVLQRHAAPPDSNPDFHAFAAALYQRLGRHREAIDQYQTALRLAPSAGVWWVGLGISLQASERPKDAAEAFTRAKSAGNLAPELASFVDQRLRQLQ